MNAHCRWILFWDRDNAKGRATFYPVCATIRDEGGQIQNTENAGEPDGDA